MTYSPAALYARLNAASAADLVYWTAAQLEQFADQAARRIARQCALFVERAAADTGTGTAVAAGQGEYAVPARYLSALHLSLDGAALRPSTRPELEALDIDWESTDGTPARYAPDAAPTGKVRLYPEPDGAGTLAWIYHAYPATVASGTVLRAPQIFQDALDWAVLEQARGEESSAAMPEVAAHAAERTALYTRLFQEYFGGAQ